MWDHAVEYLPSRVGVKGSLEVAYVKSLLEDGVACRGARQIHDGTAWNKTEPILNIFCKDRRRTR